MISTSRRASRCRTRSRREATASSQRARSVLVHGVLLLAVPDEAVHLFLERSGARVVSGRSGTRAVTTASVNSVRLHHGRSRLRLVMPTSQTSPGYVTGTIDVVTVRR